jgi:hypothetical protein
MSEVKLTFRCEGCGAVISFPSSETGMVRDCPECGGWVDVPEVVRQGTGEIPPTWGRSQSLQEELNARYFEEAVRQQGEITRQIEATRQHQEWARGNLERETAILARREELLDQAARLLVSCEQMAARFAALLSKWEKNG